MKNNISNINKEGVSVLIPTLGKINFDNFIKLINKLIYDDLIFLKNYEIIIIFNQKKKCFFYRKLQNVFSKNSKIKVFHEPKKGIVYALNYGIKKAKFEFIARQDDDDITLPLRIFKTINFLKKGNFTISFTNCFLIKNNLRRNWNKGIIKPIKIQLLFYNPFVHATMVIKKQSLLNINGYKFKSGAEDHDMFIRLAFNNERFGFLNEYLYEYNLDKSLRGNGYIRIFENYIRSLKLVVSNCFKTKVWLLGIIILIPSLLFQKCVLIKNLITLTLHKIK